MKNKPAVVLLSGGLDSATALYFAKAKGYLCHCLIFDYGQLHRKEIACAVKIAQKSGCAYKVLKIDFPWKGSSLLDKSMKLSVILSTFASLSVNSAKNLKFRDSSALRPQNDENKIIPNTYVPARNIIFLSFALSFAETIKASAIFIGAHAQDYSGYPDCRPEFFKSFIKMARVGTAGLQEIKILTPLLNKGKAQIIMLGQKLGVPFRLTWSCYRGLRWPCGKCDSCYYRAKGFKEAGVVDPLIS